MLNAVLTQFKLGDDGLIRYQPNATNPLPGEPVARLLKGDKILEPKVELLDGAAPAGEDAAAIQNFISEWTKTHIRTVLEPLVALEQTDGLAEPVAGICNRVYEAMGILPREYVEAFIEKLDPEMRQVLRTRQVRLGPILIFLPSLNKPAGVRLRGVLWSLWNDKSLPPALPHDGVVSLKVDEGVDQKFYRAIGYPVYGPRAIRIDMLDRVISAVYDSSKDGKFQAQHKMAEWLGCQIADLYEVLTAMGHKKIHDPLEQKKEEAPAGEVKTEEAKPAEAAPAAKPELATFALKKGKAHEKGASKPKAEFKRPKKPKVDKKKKPERKERPQFVASAQSKTVVESPFAILQQLKSKKDVS